jgi:uroporphyrin-III C-methyltransferase
MMKKGQIHPVFDPGSVWLTGAGPGDPGLLTLHALHGLQHADVIVYDALVSEDVLAFAREGAEREYAGKRGGRPSAKQMDISLRLVELARQGKRVLRLKGGDPFVFGRGGEEALVLTEAGIPFRVIPGITSGLAALTLAGIPATTRTTNHAVILATGHPADADHPADWAALARSGQPLILYMARRNLADIANVLIANGLAAATPVAVIVEATTPRSRIIETQLAEAAADVSAADIDTPAIVAIGSIVGLRAQLAPCLQTSWPATEPEL